MLDTATLGFAPLPPLHAAAKDSDIREIMRLITSGIDVHSLDDEGATALHWAKTTLIAECLLRSGVDINATDKQGRRPLHWRSQDDKQEGALEVLLANPQCHVDAIDTYKQTALHLAARAGNDDMVSKLLARQASLIAKDVNGCTPLDEAIASGKFSTILLLLAAGAPLTPSTLSLLLLKTERKTLLHESVYMTTSLPIITPQHLARVAALVELGFDIRAKDDQGVSALSCVENQIQDSEQQLMVAKQEQKPTFRGFGQALGLIENPLNQAINKLKALKELRELLISRAKPVPALPEQEKFVTDLQVADEHFHRDYEVLVAQPSAAQADYEARYQRYKNLYQAVYQNTMDVVELPKKPLLHEDATWVKTEEEFIYEQVRNINKTLRNYRQQATVLLDESCWQLLVTGIEKARQQEIMGQYHAFLGRNNPAEANSDWHINLPEQKLLPVFGTLERLQRLRQADTAQRLEEVKHLFDEWQVLQARKAHLMRRVAFAGAIGKRARDAERLPLLIYYYGETATRLISQTSAAARSVTAEARYITPEEIIENETAAEIFSVSMKQRQEELQAKRQQLKQDHVTKSKALEERQTYLLKQPSTGEVKQQLSALTTEQDKLKATYQHRQSELDRYQALLGDAQLGPFYCTVYDQLMAFFLVCLSASEGNSASATGTSSISAAEAGVVLRFLSTALSHGAQSRSGTEPLFSVEQMQAITAEVAQALTERYAEHIRFLTLAGCRLLAECAVDYMKAYLQAPNAKSLLAPVHQLLWAVANLSRTPREVPVQPPYAGEGWTDAGIFQETGILISEGRCFIRPGISRVEKYGYRPGTLAEISQANWEEVIMPAETASASEAKQETPLKAYEPPLLAVSVTEAPADNSVNFSNNDMLKQFEAAQLEQQKQIHEKLKRETIQLETAVENKEVVQEELKIVARQRDLKLPASAAYKDERRSITSDDIKSAQGKLADHQTHLMRIREGIKLRPLSQKAIRGSIKKAHGLAAIFSAALDKKFRPMSMRASATFEESSFDDEENIGSSKTLGTAQQTHPVHTQGLFAASASAMPAGKTSAAPASGTKSAGPQPKKK